ncbi:MAG: hypothetical protein K2P81_05810 [Bacteriovoracaceae bacterium]|nr:hypothetical protein [Bacteriovoracaceae bacterium]
MSATSTKPVFYQWQKSTGYPIFLRLSKDLHEGRMQKLVNDLGFQEIAEVDHRKVSVTRPGTKILTLTRASTRVTQQVMLKDSLDKFGSETLNYQGNAQIYLYRKIGMMVFSPTTSMWELGLASSLETTEELMGLRVMLNRYLAWALAPMSVIGFWGVSTNEGLVAMKQSQSFGEVVFVDMEKKIMHASGGSRPLEAEFTILRADKAGPTGRQIPPEELVSFLNTSNIYFTHMGLPQTLKKAALTLGSSVRGEWSGHAASSVGLSNA